MGLEMAAPRKKRKSRKGHEGRQPLMRQRHCLQHRQEDVEEMTCILARDKLESVPMPADDVVRLGELLDRLESEQEQRYPADERRAKSVPVREPIEALFNARPPLHSLIPRLQRERFAQMREMLEAGKEDLGSIYEELKNRIDETERQIEHERKKHEPARRRGLN